MQIERKMTATAFVGETSTFSSLLSKYYCSCLRCHDGSEGSLRILPCLHVVCTKCLQQIRIEAQKWMSRDPPPTKYTSEKRFLCPVCNWPHYVHSDGIDGYPFQHPALEALEKSLSEETHCDEGYEEESIFNNMVFVYSIGNHGDSEDCFTAITGMALDQSDSKETKLVVCNGSLNRISVYTIDGKYLHSFCMQESLRDVRVLSNGHIVATVAEKDYAVIEYDQSGNEVSKQFCRKGSHACVVDYEPFGLSVNDENQYTVSFLLTNSVCRLDSTDPFHLTQFGNPGKGKMGFNGPYYLGKTSFDFLIVSDMGNHRVKIHQHNNGLTMAEMGGLGSARGRLFYPHGICTDKNDNIYVADTGNYRVQVFSEKGQYLGCPVKDTWIYGENVKPTHVCVLQDGRLLVAMQGRQYCKIHVYQSREQADVDFRSDDPCCCSCFTCFCRWKHHKGYEKL